MIPSVPTRYLQKLATPTQARNISGTPDARVPPLEVIHRPVHSVVLNWNKRKLLQDRKDHIETTKLFVRQKHWKQPTIQLNSVWVSALYEQPLCLLACFSGFWGVVVEWEDGIFPVATRISESIYMSDFAKNAAFIPSSALFPFNDSFAMNPICELLK